MSRPPLRLIDGLRERADLAECEVVAVKAEAREHIRHLRLVAKQMSLWSPDEIARALVRTADRYERRIGGGNGRAA